jgi:hypothetical protein
VRVASTLPARGRLEVSSVLEKNNEVRRFAVQQTGLASKSSFAKERTEQLAK